MTTQSLNQFAPGPLVGDSIKGASLNKVSARLNPASTSAYLKAGQAVKLIAGASGEILVDAIAAGDAVIGTILYNTKRNTYAAGDIVEIALEGSIVLLETGAAVNRGAQVATDPANGAISAAASGASATGIAFGHATAAGQVIAVQIKPAAVA